MRQVPPLEPPMKRARVFLTKRKFERKNPNAKVAELAKERMVWSMNGIKEKILEIARHYWMGTKKLFWNIQLSRELKQRLLRGEYLTRREFKHIQRTSHDVQILVPFLVIMALPLTGYLLPVIVTFFPGILPSTYMDESEKLTRQQKRLECRKKVGAKVQDLLLDKLGDDPLSDAFRPLLLKIKDGHHVVTNEEVIRFNFLFDGRLSIENFSSAELKALCSYFNLWPSPFTNVATRRKLYDYIEEIQRDDKRIEAERINKTGGLSNEELVEACEERGYPGDLTRESMESQLSGWLELSLTKGVSPSLLLLVPSLHITTTP